MSRKKEYKIRYEGDVMRLTTRRKKGILALVFSRFLLVFLLLWLQIVLFIGVLEWLSDYRPFLTFLTAAITIASAIYLFSCDMDASGKLTWLFFIAIFPIPVSIFLIYTRVGLGHRRIRRRLSEIVLQTEHALPRNAETEAKLAQEGPEMADMVRWLNRSGCFPVCTGAQTEYYASGAEMFEAILKELQSAEKSIFLETFIIDEGYMWGRILEILMAKAAAGVDVRVLYDGTCEVALLPMDYNERLEAFGIHAKSFAPIRPILSSKYNNRDHRKILVVDGKVAFNGGINMADEYIGRVERFGVWKDAGVSVRGEAAESFLLMFLQMWNFDAEEPDWTPLAGLSAGTTGTDIVGMVEEPKSAENAGMAADDGYAIPYCDCPVDDYKVGETVYRDILNRAGSYVHVMTPYLILDAETENAIKFAAQRGVDVKLILPGIPDKKLPYALAKSHYRTLLDSGVKIYEFSPGFVHAKVFTSDDTKAVVGTINLDYRSLQHHYECATYLYRCKAVADAESDVQATLAQCREVTYETLKNEKLYYRVMGKLMRFVAPLL